MGFFDYQVQPLLSKNGFLLLISKGSLLWGVAFGCVLLEKILMVCWKVYAGNQCVSFLLFSSPLSNLCSAFQRDADYAVYDGASSLFLELTFMYFYAESAGDPLLPFEYITHAHFWCAEIHI